MHMAASPEPADRPQMVSVRYLWLSKCLTSVLAAVDNPSLLAPTTPSQSETPCKRFCILHEGGAWIGQWYTAAPTFRLVAPDAGVSVQLNFGWPLEFVEDVDGDTDFIAYKCAPEGFLVQLDPRGDEFARANANLVKLGSPVILAEGGGEDMAATASLVDGLDWRRLEKFYPNVLGFNRKDTVIEHPLEEETVGSPPKIEMPKKLTIAKHVRIADTVQVEDETLPQKLASSVPLLDRSWTSQQTATPTVNTTPAQPTPPIKPRPVAGRKGSFSLASLPAAMAMSFPRPSFNSFRQSFGNMRLPLKPSKLSRSTSASQLSKTSSEDDVSEPQTPLAAGAMEKKSAENQQAIPHSVPRDIPNTPKPKFTLSPFGSYGDSEEGSVVLSTNPATAVNSSPLAVAHLRDHDTNPEWSTYSSDNESTDTVLRRKRPRSASKNKPLLQAQRPITPVASVHEPNPPATLSADRELKLSTKKVAERAPSPKPAAPRTVPGRPAALPLDLPSPVSYTDPQLLAAKRQADWEKFQRQQMLWGIKPSTKVPPCFHWTFKAAALAQQSRARIRAEDQKVRIADAASSCAIESYDELDDGYTPPDPDYVETVERERRDKELMIPAQWVVGGFESTQEETDRDMRAIIGGATKWFNWPPPTIWAGYKPWGRDEFAWGEWTKGERRVDGCLW